jgi:DNA-directed RNA polymerase subunit M/transcription elongation factor TFIIS
LVFICIYVYNRCKGKNIIDEEPKVKNAIILAVPLLPILFPVVFISKMKEMVKDREDKQKEKELKASIGLRPDEKYQCFSHMGGVGIIKCGDCGYQERITCFTHGAFSCNIGRQCPKCHAFLVEYNESKEHHTFGDSNVDFVCSKCGTVVRKKEEPILKGNDDPLFCPKCHSARLYYTPMYFT